ncbi:MAG: hypothetical protein FWD23_00985 [Oscillospiraceae bacterium]|nr:hypothetical protein [Oscillospiraceae bacterium]
MIIKINENNRGIPVTEKFFMDSDAGFDFSALEIRKKSGDIFDGGLETEFAPVVDKQKKITLHSSVVIKYFPDENVVRKTLKYKFTGGDVFVKDIVLEKVDISVYKMLNDLSDYNPDIYESFASGSRVAYFDYFALGIEFPAAFTHSEGDTLFVTQIPYALKEADIWHESKTMACILSDLPGRDNIRAAFEKYIKAKAVKHNGVHFNYNGWWTSEIPIVEEKFGALLNTFRDNLYTAGAYFDSFTIDLGWSDDCSIWRINPRLFPEGFKNIQALAAEQNSSIGLWCSPGGCYEFALNNQWAKENGYDVSALYIPPIDWTMNHLCLASDKYADDMIENLSDIVGKYKLAQVKLDGAVLDCRTDGHGHIPAVGAAEKSCENLIRLFNALKAANPDVWLEPTCFAYNASPWWLMYADSVTGSFGDDQPYGVCPAPMHRESLTSARDYYNLQGAVGGFVPIDYQEVLGIIHQTEDDFTNDAVTVILRGNMFVSAYINPKYMAPERYLRLAAIMNWARKNEKILESTVPIPFEKWKNRAFDKLTGEPHPKEPYGYSHFNGYGNICLLRNPVIKMQSIEYTAPRSGDIISLYPEVRCYKKGVRAGETVDIPLLPYETVVLTVENENTTGDYPVFEREETIKIDRDKISVAADSEFLYLLESDRELPEDISVKITVNGEITEPAVSSTKDAWAAVSGKRSVHWAFYMIKLTPGTYDIAVFDGIENEPGASSSQIKKSAYVLTSKSGAAANDIFEHANALPHPEKIYCYSIQVF